VHLQNFINALGLDQFVLIGNAMGGGACLGVTMREQDRVKLLVLMGSAGIASMKEMAKGSAAMLTGFRNPEREMMARTVRMLTYDYDKDPRFEDMVEYRHQITMLPGNMEAFSAVIDWVLEHDLLYDEDEIRAVKVPALVVHGREDRGIPPEESLKFLRLLDNARLYVIPHCGHWAMIERTDDFVSIVTRAIDMSDRT
jgi:2-hydroxy-6-oxo-6-(2'-aminophenyl)hexa-2,4-dienoate hydrolase